MQEHLNNQVVTFDVIRKQGSFGNVVLNIRTTSSKILFIEKNVFQANLLIYLIKHFWLLKNNLISSDKQNLVQK